MKKFFLVKSVADVAKVKHFDDIKTASEEAEQLCKVNDEDYIVLQAIGTVGLEEKPVRWVGYE